MADAQPIGRITSEQAIPTVSAGPASSDTSAAIPTLNPADSPYTPLSLPTVDPKQVVPPEQKPVQDLGATSHAGGMAYLADQVLRGAMQGYDQAQQRKADQFNKKLAAQQSIYNDQAKQLHDMAVAGVDPNSEEFKQAQNRVMTSWQATMQTIGERIPQPKKSSKSKQGQAQGADQTSLLQRVFNHKNDPQDALQAVYQGAISTGPPVLHQIAPYLTPAYRAKQQQGAQTQQSQGAAQASTADTSATVADIDNQLAHAVQSGAPQDKIDALIKQRDELNPSQKFPVGGLKRSGQGADGKWYEWQVDQEGKEIPDTRRPLSTAGLGAKAPKIGWTKIDGKWGSQLYDAETNQPVPNTFDSTKVPPASVLSLYPSEHTLTGKFVDSNGVLQTYSTTSTSQRNVPGGVGESTPAATSSGASPTQHPKSAAEPSTTTSTTHGGTHPIGYVGSGAYKQLIKQATDAQKEFNAASVNLGTMLKTAANAKRGDGAAQVGIIASYLKTVVGGAGTGVRITKAEWDAATKTRPWMEGIKATFSPDGVMTGATISRSQVDQMVNEVHQKTKSLFENVSTARKRAQDQRTTDMSAGGLGNNQSPAAPASQPSSTFDWNAHPVAH